MIGKALAFLGLDSWVAGGLAVALAAAAGALWWQAGSIEDLRQDKANLTEEKKTLEATVALLELDAALHQQSGIERAGDESRLDQQEKELHDARHHEGDDRNTGRLRRLCRKLWQSGAAADPATTAACARLGGQP